ncbi:MAG: M20/M25/M40 family metallo-hydrolase [Candidatus Eisenbacteria bacterium]|nr:M20/M25/M40 family metallo-hydrolase [Candidatus Eisenbacteria bacterium]
MRKPEAALGHFEKNFDSYVERLKTITRIPSVSAEGFPREEVARCAEAVAAELRAAGLENVRTIVYEGSHPYAYGEWLHAPGAPTILLYGHHDVQPPGRPEVWESPAFEPTVRADGRLYARGIADDKAGVMMHVAAADSFLRAEKRLPLNVKVIIEGEEEVGSGHLEDFLRANREMLAADYLVLTDTANFEEGIPAITFQLRGMVAVDVEVAGLRGRVHSGSWGGPVPDPIMALCRILDRLVDEDGVPCDPDIRAGIRETPDAARARLQALPFDEADFMRQAGLLPGVRIAGEKKYSVYERMWTRPSLTVVAMEASLMKDATNQIVDSARARVTVRIVPDQDPEAVRDALVAALHRDPPWGVQVRAKPLHTGLWWTTEPSGPAFDAAMRALRAGYEQEPALIGCGGSIPFVKPFQDIFGGIPCLLLGVEDPTCQAHGENESLSLRDWRKAIRSAIYLYAELAELR